MTYYFSMKNPTHPEECHATITGQHAYIQEVAAKRLWESTTLSCNKELNNGKECFGKLIGIHIVFMDFTIMSRPVYFFSCDSWL